MNLVVKTVQNRQTVLHRMKISINIDNEKQTQASTLNRDTF